MPRPITVRLKLKFLPSNKFMFWFFAGFRCGVPLFIVMLVVY